MKMPSQRGGQSCRRRHERVRSSALLDVAAGLLNRRRLPGCAPELYGREALPYLGLLWRQWRQVDFRWMRGWSPAEVFCSNGARQTRGDELLGRVQ